MPCHATSNHIKTQNTNPWFSMQTLKMNVTTVKHLRANEMIMTCHVRHISCLSTKLLKKLISCNNSLNVTIQSHPMKGGCYKSNEKCLIVATINPISHSHPVHHGTFSNVLIHKFVVCKCREIIIFAHNYFKNKTQTKQIFVLNYN